MPDEKVEIVDDAGDEVMVVATESSSPPGVPLWALALVMIGLAALLMTMHFRNRAKSELSTDSPDLAQVLAEAEVLRSEQNRELAAMGLSPLQGQTESLDQVAERLQKDSATLVSLAGRFQELLAQKDAEVGAKNAEILKLDQQRQALAAEAVRLRDELQKVQTGGQDTESLRRELGTVKEQRDRLAAELSAQEATEDVQTLQRRLNEAQRARDFFEQRVKELEGAGEPKEVAQDEGLIDVEE